MMPSAAKDKVYVLNFPAGETRTLPAGLRPTVRLSNKMLAVATSPDVARLATEAKPGAWTPPADLAPAFDQLPKAMTFLSVSDPRSTVPELLATLPATLQRGCQHGHHAWARPAPRRSGGRKARGMPACPECRACPGLPGMPGTPGMPGMSGPGNSSGPGSSMPRPGMSMPAPSSSMPGCPGPAG